MGVWLVGDREVMERAGVDLQDSPGGPRKPEILGLLGNLEARDNRGLE